MERGKVIVVLDSQAGSCGKGKFIGYLAKHDNINLAINNFMSNAGHTFVSDDGTHVMTQHLPTSIVSDRCELLIGPGSAITPSILFDELIKYKDIIGDRQIVIHPRAVVIKDYHRHKEAQILKSGSTFKGCGASQADKVMRQAELFGDWWVRYCNEDMDFSEDPCGNESDLDIQPCKDDEFKYLCTIGDFEYIKSKIVVADTMPLINSEIDRGKNIIIEGSQGCDLDINYGLDYPNTTSRQCHVGQLFADCGISPKLVDEIIMIMRPYPIRISNTTNLTDENGNPIILSSGDYAGSDEITWDIVKERCGAPDDVEFGEQTTVTKKTRRVFEMNWDRLKYVVQLNRPTQIAINFAQYIDYDALGCTDWGNLPLKVKDFVAEVEEFTGVPVTLIGTGMCDYHIVDRRIQP